METIEWIAHEGLHVGDVVRLACDGPEMVVSAVGSNGTMQVMWTVGGELREAFMPPAILWLSY